MEGGFYPVWNKSVRHVLEDVEENDELRPVFTLPAILQPQTPHEPIEFLSRSWSLSASDISKAFSQKKQQFFIDKNPQAFPEAITEQVTGKTTNSVNGRRMGAFGKWFHHKECNNVTLKKKDRARVENARIHSAVSTAGLASALAAVAAVEKSSGSGSKLSLALASATEILASHCIEMAELAGADHERLASTVKSAVDIRTPGDLMTLTAAAATALRGEAALKARFPKEARKNATVSPYHRGITETHCISSQMEEKNPPCVGELMQITQKGALRWRHVSIYINKKSQVKIKLKSKHVGGAFSKKNKCVVYGICDKAAAWPYKKEREMSEEFYFGLKTAQGLLEFKCKSKIHKQKWVDEIEGLLRRVNSIEATEHSLEFLSINSI